MTVLGQSAFAWNKENQITYSKVKAIKGKIKAKHENSNSRLKSESN